MTRALPLSKNHGVPLPDPLNIIVPLKPLLSMPYSSWHWICYYQSFIVPSLSYRRALDCGQTDSSVLAVNHLPRPYLTKAQNLTLITSSNVDWVGCPDDHRFTCGYCIYLGSNIISWSSKKQPIVVHSSTIAKYRSIALASTELCWSMSILGKVSLTDLKPTLWCDNLEDMFLVTNPVVHACTEHWNWYSFC